MFHYFESITNTRGDALIGYFVKAVDSTTGNVATIYADKNLTPITSSSGIANAALVDDDGDASFFVASGEYHLDIYAPDAATFVKRVSNIPMIDFVDSALKLATVFTPEAYSAAGDGTTDDYTAFQALIAAVNLAGGGTISLGRGKTYNIDRYITATNGNIDCTLTGCTGLLIEGNGAKINFKGNFDRAVSTTRALAFYIDNSTYVTVRNLEIDGNCDLMTNTAAAAEPPCYGLGIRSCEGVLIENVYSHHHSSDGFLLRDSGSNGTNRIVSKRVTMRNCRALYNARQGMSATAVRGLVAENCQFGYTGRSTGTYTIHSPAAGVDIEPTRTTATASPDTLDVNCGNMTFSECVFDENAGSQFLCSGSVFFDNIKLLGSRIKVGGGSTTGNDCTIIGASGFAMRDCDVDIGTTNRIFYITPNAGNIAGNITVENNRFTGTGDLCRIGSAATGRVLIQDNVFKASGTAPFSSTIMTISTGSDIRFRRNRIFVPKEMYVDGGAGDRHIIFSFSAVTESERNDFTTDLLAASGDSGTAHYANAYGAATVVRDDRYTGVAVGTADTIRPDFNTTFNTSDPFNRNHFRSNAPGTVLAGNAAYSFVATTSPAIVSYATTITADRAVSLDTTAGYVFKGAKCRVVRTATGAFNVNVGTGPLKALGSANTWCEVEYTGSAWALTASGSL